MIHSINQSISNIEEQEEKENSINHLCLFSWNFRFVKKKKFDSIRKNLCEKNLTNFFFVLIFFLFWNFEIPKRKNKKHSIFTYINDVTDVVFLKTKKKFQRIHNGMTINQFLFVFFLEKLKNIFCFFCIMYTCLVYIKCIHQTNWKLFHLI